MTLIFAIPESQGAGRLGRHVEHDPRSLDFAVEPASLAALQSVAHLRHVPIFDQGQLGSCTGNAAAGCMATGPWNHATTEADAVAIYEQATRLDRIPGVYPPDDTGSSGLAAMKAVKAKGWIGGYRHAFSLHATLTALQTTPVIVGVNWYQGFDNPDRHGLVQPTGSIRGGHEFVLQAVDIQAATVTAANSWGAKWGVNGTFVMSWVTLDRLLSEHGDCTVPIR